MTKMKMMMKLIVGIILFSSAMLCSGEPMKDTDSIGNGSKTITDDQGEVTVSLDWLRRPGEFALTIDYWGYLTQEGMVNAYIEVNGVQREFITLREEGANRHQRIRILSFHPTEKSETQANRMSELYRLDVVDYQLFRNAPYYPQFGTVKIAVKFFANGRWDGDGNKNNENYSFEFSNPTRDSTPMDHF